jgi:dTDP-4-amino-4,6-dideoxygalactose transaminase
MLNTLFSVWPSYSDEEATAVAETVRSNKVNYWTGTECRQFEEEFAIFAGSRHAIALANGTVALDLALKVLGIGSGDEVIVTPRTFLASASCVVTAGATPVFADVDRDSQNITAETIAAVLTPRTRAIICVHLAGWPCDMDPIMALAAKHGLFVIEDCAQAHGARYKGRPVGGIGHMGAWSFCQDKIMTTGGEGGMLTLNDSEWWSRAWSYKDHGKSWSAVYEKAHPPGFRWVHESFGTNWRMIEMQAVIGRIQLQRMPEWTRRRGDNARRILGTCREFSAVRVPAFRCGACSGVCPTGAGCVHAQYKTYVFVRPEVLKAGWTRDRIIDEVNGAGVPCYQGSCSEVYLEKAFEGTDWRPEMRLPIAKELGETALMFLVHPTLTDAEIEKTCEVLRSVLGAASAD